MENQPPAEKGDVEAGDISDRISQLPETILQNHILSLLRKEDAVRTCILSKSWRHLGTTLPKFVFHQGSFPGKKQDFPSVVENTLQRYDDGKLSIQEFDLSMSPNPQLFSLLDKWIPIVTSKMGAKKLNLQLALNFSLPLVVFQAELLEELYLEYCNLDQINNCIVKLQLLKRLSLMRVCIEDETFQKIMSSCPLIQHLVLRSCQGMSTIKVSKAPNLKHFDCCVKTKNDSIEIDDAPSLETISIQNCENWYHHNYYNNYFFPRLKSLFLLCVHLTAESFDNFSSKNCPCLEELKLHYCFGFREFQAIKSFN